MAKMFDDIMQGMQEILEFEQGNCKLRIEKISDIPLRNLLRWYNYLCSSKNFKNGD